MAGPDFLSQIPSLEELLEHPRVKSTLDRVNRSSAAARVRGALTNLTAEVTRAKDNLQGMAPAELLDRLVKRLDEPLAPAASRVVNATGDPIARGWAAPLAPAALQASQIVAEGYHRTPATSAAAAAKRLLGCDTAVALASHAAALGVTLEALGRGGVVVVGRGDMAQVAPGVRLDDLCRRAGVTLREVGATDSATADDYRAALQESDATPAVLLRRLDAGGGPDAAALAELAGRHGATLLVDAGRTRPTEATPLYGYGAPSVQTVLEAGAHAVVFDAAGLVGAPEAGLVVGRGDPVGRVAESPAAMAAPVTSLVDAAAAATLELFTRPDTLRFTHPLYQLLDAPLENLQSRAERMAPQLAAAEGIESAEAVEIAPAAGRAASWGVRLRGAGDGGPVGLLECLAHAEPSIIAAVDRDAVLLDLRAVFPRDDRPVVTAIAPHRPGSEATDTPLNGGGGA